MSVVHHIYPLDMYRAAALNAFIVRGFTSDEAVSLAVITAEKMLQEVDKNTEYHIE